MSSSIVNFNPPDPQSSLFVNFNLRSPRFECCSSAWSSRNSRISKPNQRGSSEMRHLTTSVSLALILLHTSVTMLASFITRDHVA